MSNGTDADMPTSGRSSTVRRLRVDGNRLWDDLKALSQIGRGSRGVSRLAFSLADMEGRRWLMKRFGDAGIHPRMDRYGNVFGRLEPGARGRVPVGVPEEAPEGAQNRAPKRTPDEAPAEAPNEVGASSLILVGSHIDTVPEGGMFDGALGVLAGLECVRVIKEAGIRLPYALEVIAFANEEGSRLGPGLFGSRALFEGIPKDEWERVLPVLTQAGVWPADAGRPCSPGAGDCAPGSGDDTRDGTGGSAADAGSTAVPEAPGPLLDTRILRAYLELHIEQGGVLDASGDDIGVVQGIVCIHSFQAIFKGKPNHAGTAPMSGRKDALLGAAELILAVPDVVREVGSAITVGTCGQVRVLPGGRNIIPGEAEISIEVRDLDESVADRVVESLRLRAGEIARRRGLEHQLTPTSRTPGAMMSPELQEVIECSARALGLRTRRMPSGAGHDAAALGNKVPSGMIFVPSKEGVSHSPEEWTSKEQCESGAQVLLNTILHLMGY